MNELQIIERREVLGKDFKIYGDYENPLFLAKDVAKWIDYSESNVSKMINSVEASEKVRNIITTPGGNQETWFLTEDGLYEVLMQSRKPIAKEFKKHVKQILKSIRKHGAYIAPELKKNMAEARLLNAKARVSNQWMKLAQQVPEAEYKQICASYASAVLAGSPVIPLPPAGEKHLSAHEVGKLLGVSANQIGRIANQNGLKTEQYGKWFHDKSPHSVRQVEVFMYNSSAVDRFRELLHK